MSAPILDKQAEIEVIYKRYLEPKTQASQPGTAGTAPSGDATTLLERMFASKDGAKIRRLRDGDTSGYRSASEADLAWVSHCAWWADYGSQLTEELAKQGNLYRAKWDELRGEQTYLQVTLAKACEGKGPGDGYQAGKSKGARAASNPFGGFAGPIPEDNQNFSEDEEPWEDLKELPDLYPPVPSLPAEMLPEPLRPWLRDIAERASLPLEFVACPALVALGAVVGRTIGIHPKRHDDWLVVPNLWGGIVGRPGLMKTAAISEATRPLRRLAVDAQEQFERERIKAEVRRERITLEIAALKEDAKRSAKKGSKARDLN